MFGEKINEDEFKNTNNNVLLINVSDSSDVPFKSKHKTIRNYGYKHAIEKLNLGDNFKVICFNNEEYKFYENIKKEELFTKLKKDTFSMCNGDGMLKNMFRDNNRISVNLNITDKKRRYRHELKTRENNSKISEYNINVYILTNSDYYNQKFIMGIEYLLCYEHMNIHLITIDNTENNYNISNYSVGGLFFRALRGYDLLNKICTMRCFNNYHFNDSYLYFVHKTPEENKVIFKNIQFNANEISGFINYFSNIINNIYYEHELLPYIYYYVHTTYKIVNMCSRNTQLTEKIMNLFSKVFNNFYHNYLFEKCKDMIKNTTNIYNYLSNNVNFKHFLDEKYTNIVDKITSISDTKYVTIIPYNYCINNINKIFIVDHNNINQTVTLCDKIYTRAGYKIGSNIIPVLPLKIKMDFYANNQIICWLKNIYSVAYLIPLNSEFMMYHLLIDFAYFYAECEDVNLKEHYKMLILIVLNEKRQIDDIREIIFLQSNKPKMSNEKYSDFEITEIFCKCKNNDNEINNILLWFFIILITENDKLIQTQYNYYKSVIDKYTKVNKDINNLFENMKKEISSKLRLKKNVMSITYVENKHKESNYVSFFDDKNSLLSCASERTGFIIKPHKITNTIMCDPNYIFNDYEKYKLSNNDDENISFYCPICKTVLSRNYMLEKKKENNKGIEPYIHKKIPIFLCNNLSLENIETQRDTLFKIDNLLFDLLPFKLNVSRKTFIINKNKKYLTQVTRLDEFKKIITNNFNFLNKIDFSNVCIAGGFCRSILLDQPVNDIDFFLYGLKDNKFIDRVHSLTNDLCTQISNENKNVHFVCIYKSNNGVFELLCYEHESNKDGKKEYNNFINTYEKICKNKFRFYDVSDNQNEIVINEEKLKEYNDFIKNIKVLYKIQIILISYDDKLEILNNFDINPSKVLYDNNNVYFTNNSYMSYKYMINYLSESVINKTIITSRITKYLSYGFDIIIDNSRVKEHKTEKYLEIEGNIIKYNTVDDYEKDYITHSKNNNKNNNIYYYDNSFTLNNNFGDALYKSVTPDKSQYLYDGALSKSKLNNNNELLKTFEYIFRNNYFLNKKNPENNKNVIFYKKLDLSNLIDDTFDNGCCEITFDKGEDIMNKRRVLFLNNKSQNNKILSKIDKKLEDSSDEDSDEDSDEESDEESDSDYESQPRRR